MIKGCELVDAADGADPAFMGLFDEKDRLMVPEAKEAAGGLSRKYIIPLLNRLESDGLIKRLGDFRIKA